MKKAFTTLAIFLSVFAAQAQNLGVGTNSPSASAALDVTSTTQGMLVPRMTRDQRNMINMVSGISTPATGLLVYQTDNTPGFYYYTGTAWIGLGVAASTYPNVELNVANTTAQTITALAGSSTYQTLSFSSANNTNASLTSGNTWNGNTFTVGSGAAGWYQVNMQLMGVSTNGSNTNNISNNNATVFLDKNNAITNTPANIGSTTTNTVFPYTSGNYVLNSSSAYIRNVTYLNTIIYLQAGDFINFRAQAASTSAAANISTDGSTNMTIVRIK